MSAFAELVSRGLGALRKATIWWSVAIVLYVLLNASFWPSLEGTEMLQGYEEMGDLMAAFGVQDIATAAGYLDGQVYALMLPLILSGMAIAMTSAVTSGDEDAGRLELLQALPVGRRAVWLSRWTASAALVALGGAAATVAMVVSVAMFSFDGVSAVRVMAATVGCVLLALFHGAVAFTAGALGGSRGRSVGTALVVLVLGYVMSFLLPLAERLAGMRSWSPWYLALGQQPVSYGVDTARLGALSVVTAALVGAGLIAIGRRDIRSV